MSAGDPIYVVTGATGRVGRQVVERLLERGLRVRAVNRHGDVPAVWRAAGVEAVHGSAADAQALTQAFEGAAGVVLLAEPAFADSDPVERAAAAGAAVAKALRDGRVPCTVMLSTLGAHLESGNGIAAMGHRFERALAGATQTMVRLRSAWWMQDWAAAAALARDKGMLPSFLQRIDTPIPMVSAVDVARVVVDELLGAIGQVTIELAGPVDISPADVANAYALVLDQPIRPIPIARAEWPQMLAAWGNSPRAVALWIETFEAMDAGRLVFEAPRNARIRTMHGHQTIADVITRLSELDPNARSARTS